MTFDEWYATQKHQLSNEQVCRVIWDAATKAEREACAAVCDQHEEETCTTIFLGASDEYLDGRAMGATVCAASIRARTNQPEKTDEA